MTTIYQCDWCHARFSDRAAVASVDITIQQVAETVHMCQSCLPGFIANAVEDVDAKIDDGPEDAPNPIADGGHDLAEKATDTQEFKLPIDDYFRERVHDGHAPNQVLHNTLRECDSIDNTNLMGSHAPGEKSSRPTYHVWAEFRNEGGGHPIIRDPVKTLVERGDVKLCGVVECSDDHLIVSLRPVEQIVEPVTVRPHEIPDRAIENKSGVTIDRSDDVVPDGGDLPATCPVCDEAIDGDAERPHQCDCGHMFYELAMDGGRMPIASDLRTLADRIEMGAIADGGTAEHPERRCAVDGCHAPAVARLFGGRVTDAEGGPRCRDCLLFDLEGD